MTEPVPTEPRVVLAEPMENLIRSLRAEIEYRKTVEVDLRAELERTREVVAAAEAWRKSMQPVIANGQLPGTRPQTRALVAAVDALRTDKEGNSA